MQPDRHPQSVAYIAKPRKTDSFYSEDTASSVYEKFSMVSSIWGFHDLWDKPYTMRGWRCTLCRRTIFIGDNDLSLLYHNCFEEALHPSTRV